MENENKEEEEESILLDNNLNLTTHVSADGKYKFLVCEEDGYLYAPSLLKKTKDGTGRRKTLVQYKRNPVIEKIIVALKTHDDPPFIHDEWVCPALAAHFAFWCHPKMGAAFYEMFYERYNNVFQPSKAPSPLPPPVVAQPPAAAVLPPTKKIPAPVATPPPPPATNEYIIFLQELLKDQMDQRCAENSWRTNVQKIQYVKDSLDTDLYKNNEQLKRACEQLLTVLHQSIAKDLDSRYRKQEETTDDEREEEPPRKKQKRPSSIDPRKELGGLYRSPFAQLKE